mmetsp:Transcript_14040/g.36171  ORF Transcript_14040/g.36171 Transcript_14040/m.36171 type:complete len:385 (+) Transcript_14040:221-1375(+)
MVSANNVRATFPVTMTVKFRTKAVGGSGLRQRLCATVKATLDLSSIGLDKYKKEKYVKIMYSAAVCGTFNIENPAEARVPIVFDVAGFPPVTVVHEFKPILPLIGQGKPSTMTSEAEPLALHTKRLCEFLCVAAAGKSVPPQQLCQTLGTIATFRLRLQMVENKKDARQLFDVNTDSPGLLAECSACCWQAFQNDPRTFRANLKAHGRVVKPTEAIRVCETLVRYFLVVDGAVRMKSCPPIMQAFFEHDPKTVWENHVDVSDCGLGDGVHAEMRLLHRFGAARISVNRNCFGIERKCCLACFFAMHDQNVPDLASHGKLFKWPLSAGQFNTGFNFQGFSATRLSNTLDAIGTRSSNRAHTTACERYGIDPALAIRCPASDLWDP